MPTENEMKFLLRLNCESKITPFCTTAKDIKQGYLFTSKGASLRVRRSQIRGSSGSSYTMTYKSHTHAGRVVEIETSIDERDFSDLWPQCVQKLVKTRYICPHKKDVWEIDFFHCHRDETYIVIAEIEMPEGKQRPNVIPDFVKECLVMEVPLTDCRFSSKLLADVRYATDLYSTVLREHQSCRFPMK
jgi:CYTH domain-containing protein